MVDLSHGARAEAWADEGIAHILVAHVADLAALILRRDTYCNVARLMKHCHTVRSEVLIGNEGVGHARFDYR